MSLSPLPLSPSPLTLPLPPSPSSSPSLFTSLPLLSHSSPPSLSLSLPLLPLPPPHSLSTSLPPPLSLFPSLSRSLSISFMPIPAYSPSTSSLQCMCDMLLSCVTMCYGLLAFAFDLKELFCWSTTSCGSVWMGRS